MPLVSRWASLLFPSDFLSLNFSARLTRDLLLVTIKFALILLAKLGKGSAYSRGARRAITQKRVGKSRREVSFLFRTKVSSELPSVLRFFFQGQWRNFKLVRSKPRAVNAITRRTPRTREALSRVTIANRVPLAPPARKSPKT